MARIRSVRKGSNYLLLPNDFMKKSYLEQLNPDLLKLKFRSLTFKFLPSVDFLPGTKQLNNNSPWSFLCF